MKITGIAEAAAATSPPAALFRISAQRWRKQMARLFDPYRPELHYLRGPGPKCREKQALSERAL
jgi:hypothetical protein